MRYYKQALLGSLALFLGQRLNVLFYQSQEWAGDYLPTGVGYYASIGDVLQAVGFALVTISLLRIGCESNINLDYRNCIVSPYVVR